VDCVLVIMPERVARKGVRISLAVNLRFPGAGNSAQGQSEPKARPKGVVDGKQVNIPAPPHMSDGVTGFFKPTGGRKSRIKPEEWP
jgi:hypothetical protein